MIGQLFYINSMKLMNEYKCIWKNDNNYENGLPTNSKKTMWNDLVQTICKIPHPTLKENFNK